MSHVSSHAPPRSGGQGFFHAVVRGYGNLGRGALVLILSLAATAAAGAVLVYPLWFFATRSPHAYTATVLILAGVAICFLFGRWFLRARRVADDGYRTPIRRIGLAVARILSVALLVLGLYIDILILQLGRIVPGILLAGALVFVVGYVFSGFGGSRGGGRHAA